MNPMAEYNINLSLVAAKYHNLTGHVAYVLIGNHTSTIFEGIAILIHVSDVIR